MRELLQAAYFAALETASPARLLAPHLEALVQAGRRPTFILAFGKASLPMARAALSVFAGVDTLIVPPAGTADLSAPACATVMPTAHPVPDERSVAAGTEALRRLALLGPTDEVLVLISGGGSSLLCAPRGVSLAQKQALTRSLLQAGANIHEINTVRSQLSALKGGQLLRATRASVQTLILSDVVGDDIGIIASGPTVATYSTYTDALGVLERYGIAAPEVRAYLQAQLAQAQPLENPEGTLCNTIIGSNGLLLQAAQSYLAQRGVQAQILGDTFMGEARELARLHADLLEQRAAQPTVLLSGGEATVSLRGETESWGVGGRNQEFALALLLQLSERKLERRIYALSAGSDGIDGQSEAAGAFLTPDSWARAQALELDAAQYLRQHNSGRFFARLGDQLITGPTGHNLNDIRLLAKV